MAVNKKATLSLTLGIIGMIAWIIPIIGFPITIIALVFGIKGLKTKKRNRAIAGIVLAIIGIALSIANSAIGAYMGAIGQHPLLKNYKEDSFINQKPLNESFKNCSNGYKLYAKYYGPNEDGVMSKLKLEVVKDDIENVYEMIAATSATGDSKFENKENSLTFMEYKGAVVLTKGESDALTICN